MIYGVGIDLIKSERLQKAIEKWGEPFLSRVFTPLEIRYCEGKRRRYECYAARFAAKEAIIKALKGEWRGKIRWLDLEIINAGGGKPQALLHGEAKRFAHRLGLKEISLSLSHSKGYSVAVAIALREKGD